MLSANRMWYLAVAAIVFAIALVTLREAHPIVPTVIIALGFVPLGLSYLPSRLSNPLRRNR